MLSFLILSVTNDLELEAEDEVSYVWYNATSNTEIATTSEPVIELENLNSSAEYGLTVIINGCEINSENYYILVNSTPNETASIPQNEIFLCDAVLPIVQAIEPLESQGNWASLGAAIVLNPSSSTSGVINLEEGTNAFVWSLSNSICGVFSSDTVYIIEETSISLNNDFYILEQNTSLIEEDITQNDEITSIENWTFEIITQPLNGELVDQENGVITYIPNQDFVGEDLFVYSLCNINCEDVCEEASVRITVQNTEFTDECFIPNGITPNEDNQNDALEFPCLEDNQYPNNSIMIFNRLGDKVYAAASYLNDWKGTFKGRELPAGTYFFILQMEEGSEPIQEFFTIIY